MTEWYSTWWCFMRITEDRQTPQTGRWPQNEAYVIENLSDVLEFGPTWLQYYYYFFLIIIFNTWVHFWQSNAKFYSTRYMLKNMQHYFRIYNKQLYALLLYISQSFLQRIPFQTKHSFPCTFFLPICLLRFLRKHVYRNTFKVDKRECYKNCARGRPIICHQIRWRLNMYIYKQVLRGNSSSSFLCCHI